MEPRGETSAKNQARSTTRSRWGRRRIFGIASKKANASGGRMPRKRCSAARRCAVPRRRSRAKFCAPQRAGHCGFAEPIRRRRCYQMPAARTGHGARHRSQDAVGTERGQDVPQVEDGDAGCVLGKPTRAGQGDIGTPRAIAAFKGAAAADAGPVPAAAPILPAVRSVRQPDRPPRPPEPKETARTRTQEPAL